jgi:hypothetical protein
MLFKLRKLILVIIISVIVYYIYPIPNSFWLKIHAKSVETLKVFSKNVQSDILFIGFRNNEVGPSKISIVLTGSTPLNKNEFTNQVRLYTKIQRL